MINPYADERHNFLPTTVPVVFLGAHPRRERADSVSLDEAAAGQTATYGARGLGGMDFHRYLTGAAGPYDHDTALGDFEALLTAYRPDGIYTHSTFESHYDHQAVGYFVAETALSPLMMTVACWERT